MICIYSIEGENFEMVHTERKRCQSMPHWYSFSDLDDPGARLLKSFVITRSMLKVEHTVFEGNLSSCFLILFFYSRFRFLKESATNMGVRKLDLEDYY